MTIAAIVLGAGAGARMGAPKQFLELTPGVRIIDRVVATCRAATEWVGLVLPPGVEWDGGDVDRLIEGGTTRSESVAAGVAALPPSAEIVVVHSASHPLASVDLMHRVIAVVEAGADGCVPILAAADTIKHRDDDGTLTTVGRDGLGAAQAPMAYDRTMLDRALAALDTAVDESVAVEAAGGRVIAVDGEPANLHVTDRASLAIVRHLATLT